MLGAPVSSARHSVRQLSGRGLIPLLLGALASVPLAQDVGFEGPSFSGAGADRKSVV